MAMPLDPPPSGGGGDPSPRGSGPSAGAPPSNAARSAGTTRSRSPPMLPSVNDGATRGVGFAIDVRDAPIVADDRDVACLALPAGDVRALAQPGEAEREECGDGVHAAVMLRPGHRQPRHQALRVVREADPVDAVGGL